MVLQAREPPRTLGPRLGQRLLSWGEGDHNHPLPTQTAAGHVGDAMGKGKPSSPFPSRAAASRGTGGALGSTREGGHASRRRDKGAGSGALRVQQGADLGAWEGQQ